MNSSMRPYGLAIKITLPFLALFALLLLALGIVIARQILADVEDQVEDKQRFVLEVCSFRGFAFEEEMLREIRNLAAGHKNTNGASSTTEPPNQPLLSEGDVGDILVLEDGGRKLTTLPANAIYTETILAEFETILARTPTLKSTSSTISRTQLTLENRQWLVLYTSRTVRNTSVRRYFYLIYPFERIEHAKNNALTRIVTLGSLGLFLAAALGFGVAHWISRPVRRLAAATRRISAGGLNEPLDPYFFPVSSTPSQNSAVDENSSGDDIDHLTVTFRNMVLSLRKSQDELLKAERLAATGKLATCVAHEIRNPLTSLRMTVEMLQQRPNVDAGTLEAYKIILNEIERLALSVDELLTFARPRPAQRMPIDLNQLITATLTFMERQMEHAHVKSETALDATLPNDLHLDSNKIRQLLVNLILNAQQAIVRNGTVKVSTEWDAQNEQVLLSVKDSGPGIPPEVRDKMFELFVTTKAGGGGLGLTIAKQIVEEHNGTIRFETSEKGTTFCVKLPRA